MVMGGRHSTLSSTNLLFVITMLVALNSCFSRDCSELPAWFSSYKEAKTIISQTDFYFEDSVWAWRSSWIDRASFHSCDGQTGFLVIHANGRTYIHDKVPIQLLYEFKDAYSYMRF